MILLDLEEIARAVDVSRATGERWRSGQTAPSAGVMSLIIDGITKATGKKILIKLQAIYSLPEIGMYDEKMKEFIQQLLKEVKQ